VPPAIDGGEAEGVAEAVEGERPRQADDMAAIDDARLKRPPFSLCWLLARAGSPEPVAVM
jgi:hypothetical protein